jgi:hypothetical protein
MPSKDAKEAGLTRAILADQGETISRIHGQRNVVEYALVRE